MNARIGTRPPTIQYRGHNVARVTRVPPWSVRRWMSSMISVENGESRGKMRGCFSSWSRSEFRSLPSTRNNPASSTNGVRRMRELVREICFPRKSSFTSCSKYAACVCFAQNKRAISRSLGVSSDDGSPMTCDLLIFRVAQETHAATRRRVLKLEKRSTSSHSFGNSSLFAMLIGILRTLRAISESMEGIDDGQDAECCESYAGPFHHGVSSLSC